LSVDLNALAHQIASELAKGDLARPAPGASPPFRIDGVVTPPRGVSWVSERARLADFIDHTLLRAEATRADVERHCAEAAELGFAAVCVSPVWVSLCRSLLAGTRVRVATVVGYPTGAQRSEVKAVEARLAVDDGADELDVVAALGLVKSGAWSAVADDLASVVRAAQGRLVKVVVETAALGPAEIVRAAVVAREEGADYVKTSSGAHPAGGATPEAVALLRLVCGDALGVKASGGVRDCDAAARMIAAGATRIGTSHGVSMADCTVPGPLPLAALFGAGSADPAASRDRQPPARPAGPGLGSSGSLP
jgi:deoxyribose-phosphate aldolase